MNSVNYRPLRELDPDDEGFYKECYGEVEEVNEKLKKSSPPPNSTEKGRTKIHWLVSGK